MALDGGGGSAPEAASGASPGEATPRTAVLVTGMHRNGTSALTRVLSLLGAALPEDLVPANEGNPEGHWEPRGMVDLNDRMLAQAGSDLYSARDIAPEWFSSSAADGFVEDAARWVGKAFGGERLVVLKDPRTALLAPVWNRALSSSGYRVAHVLPLRPPAEVAASLSRRHLKTIPYDAWATPRGEAVWLRYTLAAVRGAQGHPHAFLPYGDLLADWRREVLRIGAELGIAWPGLGGAADARVDAFLHANEHAAQAHAPPPGDACDLRRLDLPSLASACYAELATRRATCASVDAIQGEFTDRIARAGDLISGLEDLYALVWRFFQEGEAARVRLDLSVAAEARLRDKVRQSWAALTAANDDKLRMLLDVGSRDKQITSLKDQAARLEGAVADGAARGADFEHEIARLRGTIEGLDGRVSHGMERSDELEGEVAQLRGARDRLAAEHDARIGEQRRLVDEARRAREDAEARLDALRTSASWRITAPLRAVSRAVRGRPR